MVPYLLPFIYLALCFAIAFLGRHSRVGYWGTFAASLLLTPIIVFIALLLFGERRDASRA